MITPGVFCDFANLDHCKAGFSIHNSDGIKTIIALEQCEVPNLPEANRYRRHSGFRLQSRRENHVC